MKAVQPKWFAIGAMTLMLCLAGLIMIGEAQAQRFMDNGDGTVTDTSTNLMWTRDANPFEKLDWVNATARCNSFNVYAMHDWRLPSLDELRALSSAMQSAHPFTGFGQLPYSYWSSTTAPDMKDFSMAWSVDMSYGDYWSTIMTDALYVWCVRDSR